MIHSIDPADLPKTYTVQARRYREGCIWQTAYKGKRVQFRFGAVIRTKQVAGKFGDMYSHHVVEVLPCA